MTQISAFYQRNGISSAVKVTTHEIEQGCLLLVLTNVDNATEDDAMGCLVNRIGERAFEAYRSVGQNRDTCKSLAPFAKREPVSSGRPPAEYVRNILMPRHQRIDAEIACVLECMETGACAVDADEKCWRRIADTADRRGCKTVSHSARFGGDDADGRAEARHAIAEGGFLDNIKPMGRDIHVSL